MTLRVRRDVPSLRSRRLLRELERSFSQACARRGFRLVHYAIQRDHAHLIVEADDAGALARGMMAIGARLARAVNRALARRGPVLADRFHHQVLRTPRQVRSALSYVLLNARKHSRGVGRAVGIDPASSGRWFDGWSRKVETGCPEQRRPVARARTWLLVAGWRRHRLIDPDDVPGRRP